jgi:hypothetical protein
MAHKQYHVFVNNLKTCIDSLDNILYNLNILYPICIDKHLLDIFLLHTYYTECI